MRVVLRVIGLALLLCGLVVLGLDLAAGAGPFATDMGGLWYRLHPYSLGLAQVVVQRYLVPEAWDPWIVTGLLWPATAVLAVPGVLLLLVSGLGRGSRRRYPGP